MTNASTKAQRAFRQIAIACMAITSACAAANDHADWLWHCTLDDHNSSACVQPYAEGLAAVRTVSASHPHGLWGFIDPQGRMAIAPRFTEVDSFSQGLAAAAEGGKWGYITPKGEWAIPPQFDEASLFNAKGFAFVIVKGAHHLIDRTGQRIRQTPPLHMYWAPGRGAALAPVTVSPAMQLWRHETGKALPLPDDVHAVHAPTGGLIPAARKVARGAPTWGVLNPDMSWAATPEQLQSDAPPVHHAGVFLVTRESRPLFVNARGEPLHPADHFDQIEALASGVWFVRLKQGEQPQLLDAQLKLLHDFGKPAAETPYLRWADAGPWKVAAGPRELVLVHAQGRVLRLPYENASVDYQLGRLWITQESTHTRHPEWNIDRTRLVQALDDDGQPLLSADTIQQLKPYAIEVLRHDGDASPPGWVAAKLDPDDSDLPPALLTVQGQILTAPDWRAFPAAIRANDRAVIVADKDEVARAIGPDGRAITSQPLRILSRFDDGLAWVQTAPADREAASYYLLHESGRTVPVSRTQREQCDRTLMAGQLVCGIPGIGSSDKRHLWNPLTGARSKHDYDQLEPLDAPGHIKAQQGDKWGVINIQGDWVIPPAATGAYNLKALSPYIVQVTLPGDERNTHRLVDLRTGADLVGLASEIAPLNGGGFRVLTTAGHTVVLGPTGQPALRIDIPKADVKVHGDWVLVTPPERTGLLDGEGHWATPATYAEIGNARGAAGLRIATRLDDTKDILDAQGRVVRQLPAGASLDVGHKLMVMSDKESKASTLLNAQWQALPALAGPLALLDDFWSTADADTPDVVLNTETERHGYIDDTGKVLVSPVFDRLEPLHNGRGRAIQKNRFGIKMGYVDRSGQFVIPAQYDRASPFQEQRALVMRQNVLQAIDPQGKVTTRFEMRCGQFIILASDGAQSWPLKPVACPAAKPARKAR